MNKTNSKTICDKVAVTYSWNRISYVINQSLSNRGIKVYTGDTSILNMNKFSLLRNTCFRYPNFYRSKESFLNFLISYLNERNIIYLIPTHEEIFIISKYKDQLGAIKTLVPDFNSLRTAHKKELSSSLAKRLGIPIPETITPLTTADCISFLNAHKKPVVLKYFNSNSSKNVYYISDPDTLASHYNRIGSFILQEYVDGVGYGVSMLYNQGSLRASFTHKRLEEKLSTGGTSTLRTGTRNELLESWSKTLLDHLSWNGVAMVEYKYNEKSKRGWFIEINPRFWGSLALPYYSGMDFPYLYYQILKEGDVDETFNYREGVKVKWILGGALGFLDGIKHDKRIKLNHLSLKADHYDDFSITDPFIIAGEVAYYLGKFINTFDLNPIKNSSLDIDVI